MSEETRVKAATEMVAALLAIARSTNPQYFRSYFMGAVVANVIGNLPDEYWKEFTNCKPCSEVMCNCHLLTAQVMPALEAIRCDHNDNTPHTINE